LFSNKEVSEIKSTTDAINYVKSSHVESSSITTDKYINNLVNSDSTVTRKIGWDAQKVDDDTYFVYYGVDFDSDTENGYQIYCYEVKVKNKKVNIIYKDEALLNKYKDLDLIE
jgi:hypothetical protein